MGVVGHRARADVGGGRSGEPQELVDLVARDVVEDPAGALPVVEPVRTSLTAPEVRTIASPAGSQAEGLEAGANPALAVQLAGLDRATNFEPLGEGDRPKPAGLGDRPL